MYHDAKLKLKSYLLYRFVTATLIATMTYPTTSSFTTFLTSPTRTPLIATIAPGLDSASAPTKELASMIRSGVMGRLIVTTSLTNLRTTAICVNVIWSSDVSLKAWIGEDRVQKHNILFRP